MAKFSTRIHWQAPATVISALLAGALFAIGHHIFYNSLDGKPAPNENYKVLGSHVSTQQVNIAGGTALAFLVKACLVTAIGAAYAQLFWRAMLHRTPEVTLERLDTTYSAVSSIHQMFKVWIWWRYPALFSLALVAWLVPLASVVTPATLSIVSAAVVPTKFRLQHVPNVDFFSLNYLNYMTSGASTFSYETPNLPTQYFYAGPSRAVTTVAQAVAAEGSILAIKPPSLNSSYTLTFIGPALQCSDVPPPLRSLMQNQIARATQPIDNDCKAYGFLAWTPAQNANESGLLPVPLPFTQISNRSYVVNAAPLTNRAGPAPASVYLAAIPDMMISSSFITHQITGACVDLTENINSTRPFRNRTFLQCNLHNSTYTAQFTFVDGEQHISVQTTPHEDKVITSLDWVFGPSLYAGRGTIASSPDCSPFTLNQNKTCMFNPTLLSTLTYQAVFESFNALFVGSVWAKYSGANVAFESNIRDTILSESPELEYLAQPTSSESLVSLQQSVIASNGTLYDGLFSNHSTVTSKPLSYAMEELFRNITISLMTSRKLQPNLASVFAPPMTNVTLNNYHNVYTYAAYKLWIAYGLAILFSSICALVGLITIGANGASYSLGFSTVLRASRAAYTDVQLKAEDADIRDPLPSHLAKAKLWLGSPPEGANMTESRVANDASQANTVGPSSTLLRSSDSGLNHRTSGVSSIVR